MEIKFQNLFYMFPNQTIFNSLNVTIPSGKITCLLGKNGSGKSIFVNLLRLIRLPKKGSIFVGDYEITSRGMLQNVLEYENQIGYVSSFPEENYSYDTVLKEFLAQLEKFHYNPAKRRKHIEDALEIVGLSLDYLYRDPFSLSSGEMRLVSLAIALSHNPKILILENPTIGLDKERKRTVINLLMRLKSRYKKTILIVSQDMNFINEIADTIVILKDGKVWKQGAKKEIFAASKGLVKEGFSLPDMVSFRELALDKKKIRLGYQSDVNDLVKDILRQE